MPDEDNLQRTPTLVAFRVAPTLLGLLDAAAAEEGVSRADIARRALIRDLRTARHAQQGDAA